MLYRCCVCGLSKPADEFYVDRSKASGRASGCKQCHRARSRARYRAGNPRYCSCGKLLPRYARRCRDCSSARERDRQRKRTVTLSCEKCAGTWTVMRQGRGTYATTCPDCRAMATAHRLALIENRSRDRLARKAPRRWRRPRHKPSWAFCPRCGTWHIRKHSRQRYCSTECRIAPSTEPVCARCGAWTGVFLANCQACRREVRSERRRREKQRRLEREKGVVTEPYTLTDIAMRDGRRCGICGRLVLMEKSVPHPKAPTIDHILPIFVGGDDTRSNVQLAHFLCNSTKSWTGTAQLMLVG